ncbi:MAG: hypothetical protein Kow00121_47000 [Elainellaceae cyanobacterium]
MYELITTIIILAVVILLIRFVFGKLIPRDYITWFGFAVLLVILVVIFFQPDNRFAGIFWAILSFPFRPLGLVILLLGYALARVIVVDISVVRWKPPWLINVVVKDVQIIYAVSQVLAAMLLLVIFSLPITAFFLTAQTEQRTALEFSQRSVGNVEAIVVLGDGTSPADPAYRVRTQLSNTENGLSVALESRLSYAARLYEEQCSQGGNPLVIVTAGPQALLSIPGVTSVDAITSYLAERGVASDRIRVDVEAFDPRTSAVAVRKILLGPNAVPECSIFIVCNDGNIEQAEAPGLDVIVPVMVVTPALMLRRAVSTFTNLGFDTVARPTDFYVFQIQGGLELAAFTDFIPNAEALTITTRAFDEYFAWIYYFIRGWLTDPLGL